MPIRIPPDEKVAFESRLTLIRLITTLYDQLIDSDEGVKAKVKTTLSEKKVKFAESDLAIAALRAGAASSWIDPRKLYALVENKTLSMKQFLECITVRKEPLKQHLSGEQIDRLSTTGAPPSPSLVTEFKPGVQVDIDRITEAMLSVLESPAVSGQ